MSNSVQTQEMKIKTELAKLGLSFLDGPNGFAVLKDGQFVGSCYLDDDEKWYVNKDLFEFVGEEWVQNTIL